MGGVGKEKQLTTLGCEEIFFQGHILTTAGNAVRAVKFIVKKSKCAGFAQEIGFSAPNSCSLPPLVKGATQLCTSKKECNKLDLIATQYFLLANHNEWSRWFAISSSHVCAVPVTVLFVGLPKKKKLNLDI
jgi:hypothetical protein